MTTPELDRKAPVEQPDVPPPTPKSTTRSRSTLPAWRGLIYRLHFYAGIVVAPFILIAALSGGLYAIAPTIENIAYRDYLHVDSTGPDVPVDQQVRAAEQLRPDLELVAVQPATESGATTRVLFADPTLGESERHAVFVDPTTANPVGESTVYGSSGALPFRAWVGQLHRHLHLGEPGRLYSEFAASWMWVIALGGLFLWVVRYRRRRTANAAEARLLTPGRGGKGHSRTVNWHGAVGVWILLPVLFLSATGLTWSTYAGANVDEMRAAFNWKTPVVDSSLGTGAAAPAHGDHGGAKATGTGPSETTVAQIDSVLRTARAAGIDGPVEVSIPAAESTAFVVKEQRLSGVLAIDSVAVDGATGQISDELRFAEWPLAAKLSSWGIQLHMGMMFGLANQLLLLAVIVALVSVVIRGYVMWWRRRPTRGSTLAVGRVPTRGSIRKIPPLGIAAIVVVGLGVGYFVPLLGLGLLAFLFVDLTVSAYKWAAST
ncbi:PepSY-associated TM helix domain-containing protein [Antrihabitans spumae]|uniref:PepSY-associated TM helix domain-containing protein n=1 Tax=Antrihabitans spumae TaxID=3373370 RepID=A0ABW7KAM0_9NOCA